MPLTIEEKIVNALEIEANEEKPGFEIAPVCSSSGNPEQDADEDLEFARVQLRSVLEKAQDALDTTIEFARACEKPQAYQAIAEILQATTTAANTLMNVHKTRRDITKKSEAGGDTYNQTAVFVGNTKDLLQTIKDAMAPVIDVK